MDTVPHTKYQAVNAEMTPIPPRTFGEAGVKARLVALFALNERADVPEPAQGTFDPIAAIRELRDA